jgi:hypothetical protein
MMEREIALGGSKIEFKFPCHMHKFLKINLHTLMRKKIFILLI